MELTTIHKNIKLLSMASSREDYFPKQTFEIGLDNDKNGIFKWFDPDNNFPEIVINSVRKGTTLESILSEDLVYKTGSGFNTNDSAFSNYLNKEVVNIRKQNFKTVFENTNDHYNKLGNVFIELIFTEDLQLISNETIQPQKVRLKKDKKSVWITSDWMHFNKDKSLSLPLYPNMKKFRDGGVSYLKSVYHIKDEALGFDHYGINEKMIESLLLNEKEHGRNEWQNSQIKNGFKKDFFLVTDFPLNEKEKKKNDLAFSKKSGADNAGGVETIEAEGATLVPAQQTYDFDFTKDDTSSQLFLKWGMPKSLLGIKGDNIFSAEQIESDYDQYLPKVEKQQVYLLTEFNKIFDAHTKFNTSDVNVINTPPSIILQNYMEHMTEEQKNKVIEKVFKRYGID